MILHDAECELNTGGSSGQDASGWAGTLAVNFTILRKHTLLY